MGCAFLASPLTTCLLNEQRDLKILKNWKCCTMSHSPMKELFGRCKLFCPWVDRSYPIRNIDKVTTIW